MSENFLSQSIMTVLRGLCSWTDDDATNLYAVESGLQYLWHDNDGTGTGNS